MIQWQNLWHRDFPVSQYGHPTQKLKVMKVKRFVFIHCSVDKLPDNVTLQTF